MILVTGGLGYIGSHTVVELIESGAEVVIVDDLSNSDIRVLAGIEFITGVKPKFYQINLLNKAELNKIFTENPIKGVIHFAAFKAVGDSVQNPLAYYQNNLIGLLNLVEAMKDHQVTQLIFSSSCTVYGQADALPITEEAPIKQAESPYGKTKQMGESILQDCINAYSLQVIALRYFNPIGAHHSSKIGELPLGVPNNLIPYITQTAAKLREKLMVFGNDYPTKDGTAVRDYIHVTDLAQAHIKAMQRLMTNQNEQAYEVFNLGTGTGSTVLEVIQAFNEANQLNVPYAITDRRAGDITAAYANNNLAKEKLGWEPKIQLKEALKTAWDWQKTLI